MTLKHFLPLVFLVGCAHSMPGLVDMEFWYKDCRPYSFPKGLPTITPNSPDRPPFPRLKPPSGLLCIGQNAPV